MLVENSRDRRRIVCVPLPVPVQAVPHRPSRMFLWCRARVPLPNPLPPAAKPSGVAQARHHRSSRHHVTHVQDLQLIIVSMDVEWNGPSCILWGAVGVATRC